MKQLNNEGSNTMKDTIALYLTKEDLTTLYFSLRDLRTHITSEKVKNDLTDLIQYVCDSKTNFDTTVKYSDKYGTSAYKQNKD